MWIPRQAGISGIIAPTPSPLPIHTRTIAQRGVASTIPPDQTASLRLTTSSISSSSAVTTTSSSSSSSSTAGYKGAFNWHSMTGQLSSDSSDPDFPKGSSTLPSPVSDISTDGSPEMAPQQEQPMETTYVRLGGAESGVRRNRYTSVLSVSLFSLVLSSLL